MTISLTVPPELSGTPLRNVIRKLGFPAQQTSLLFKTDGIRVDGEFVYPNQPVFTGEVLELSFPGFRPTLKAAESEFPLPEILYEDEAYLIFFKPAGVATHPGRKTAGVLQDSMETRAHCAGHLVHSVHRLDAETQGILVFARFPYAQVALQKQMAAGTFHKLYEAYVLGTLPARSGLIDAPIERKHRYSYTRIVREDGKPSLSSYTVLNTFQI
ncbi:MAG: RluA family pseudouridine synthase, partial [Clostridia bacterium]|nr:RluA family pseudouridine synthase [Clostridia bacterium]